MYQELLGLNAKHGAHSPACVSALSENWATSARSVALGPCSVVASAPDLVGVVSLCNYFGVTHTHTQRRDIPNNSMESK